MVIAPAAAYPRAIAWPMPLVPPSTTAIFPLIENCSSGFIKCNDTIQNPLSRHTLMKFVTFHRNGASEPGVLIDSNVVSLKGAGFASMLDVIAGGVAAPRR